MLLITDQEKNRLLTAWQTLGHAERHTLRLFAEFLSQQSTAQATAQQAALPQEPLPIPKPAKESAVLALKRLKKSYPMIEADFSLLEDASQLLLKKIMGREDAEVIVELEALFAQRYAVWKNNALDAGQ